MGKLVVSKNFLLFTFIYIVNGVVSGEIYTTGKKFYTAAGGDGIDKFHLCTSIQPLSLNLVISNGNQYLNHCT